MSWPVIPKVINGVTGFNETGMNPIIRGLEDRTSYLLSQLDTKGANTAIVQRISRVSGCTRGQFVAYDPSTLQYVPASPTWNTTGTAPSPLSYVAGVLITSPDAEGYALCQSAGAVSDPAILAAITGGSPVPGVYYLSDNGKASPIVEGTFAVSCGTYDAVKKFTVKINVPDYTGHVHTRYEVPSAAWQDIATFTSTAPVGAVAWVPAGTDNVLDKLLQLGIQSLTGFLSGRLLNETELVSTDGDLFLCTPIAAISTIEVTVGSYAPVTGHATPVKAVVPADTNKVLSAKMVNNTVVMDLMFPPADNLQVKGKAVTGISNQGIGTMDVVNYVKSGIGVEVTPEWSQGAPVPGSFLLNASTPLRTYIDMQLLNADGALLGGQDSALIVFPAGRVSSVSGNLRVPWFEGIEAYGTLFFWFKGNGSALPSASGTVTVQDSPLPGEPVILATSSELVFDSLASSLTDRMYMIESLTPLRVTPNALVNLKLQFNTPSTGVKLSSVGFVFNT